MWKKKLDEKGEQSKLNTTAETKKKKKKGGMQWEITDWGVCHEVLQEGRIEIRVNVGRKNTKAAIVNRIS